MHSYEREPQPQQRQISQCNHRTSPPSLRSLLEIRYLLIIVCGSSHCVFIVDPNHIISVCIFVKSSSKWTRHFLHFTATIEEMNRAKIQWYFLFVALMIFPFHATENNRTFNLTLLHGVEEPTESECVVADEEKEKKKITDNLTKIGIWSQKRFHACIKSAVYRIDISLSLYVGIA